MYRFSMLVCILVPRPALHNLMYAPHIPLTIPLVKLRKILRPHLRLGSHAHFPTRSTTP